MKILGDIRPMTNQPTAYTLVTNAGAPVKVNQWAAYHKNSLLTQNSKGVFTFGINTANLTIKIVAKVRDPKTDKLVDFHIEIKPLAGKPDIEKVEWQDVNKKALGDKEVAYLDRVTLVIKTKNIPQGDTLKVTIHEDEKVDGHGDSSRDMGEYTTKPITKNGYAFLELNNMSLFSKKLNAMDYINESVHEYYAKIYYYKGKVNEIKDSIQLKVKNEPIQTIKPDETNKPVVVHTNERSSKTEKKPLDFTFGVFLDGTLNNMYNTEARLAFEAKNNKQNAISQKDVDRFNKPNAVFNNNEKYRFEKDSSYENALSNPAILFKNYIADFKSSFKVYTEGIGTLTTPKKGKSILSKEDYKDDESINGPGFGMGDAGIKMKVRKALDDVVLNIGKNIDNNKYLNTITFDVYGFSRGAAAARHFVHVVKASSYIPKTSTTGKVTGTIEDFQGYDLNDGYKNRYMPAFGYLGQLLLEANLIDDRTKVNVRFVGIYDTVPHHGATQANDIKDLGLDDVNKADYVVHIVAADEHRANFSLADISSVVKTNPKSNKKGGIELKFPGVHCDVGGAYEEGKTDNPKRIEAAVLESSLEPLRSELIRQGWFKEDEIFIKFDALGTGIITKNLHRLEGLRKLSNQYSYIPLHIMAEVSKLKSVPINKKEMEDGYNFYENTKINGIIGNVEFLKGIKQILREYTFGGNTSLFFSEHKEKENGNKTIKFLRNHYLHWNSTYGESGIDMAVHTNYPNKVRGVRKRHIR
ncbi:phospholipase effector Tle1 domain-containing protein [Chryseobacterium wangxinyae]|uniref:phospholipase effector Tle1 domain-containing protein n=1 Tax=Chryseobacterium sp. CY353 TaxID=2997334 RepID=UPI00226E4873|nr:DUF2235 domain-containing protein [Chryseobacterium sp. CY353]MCY0970729.1 DUF2235 domain-containing protein [Chryseobacterium sp. CY353]